jgi:hypothetical protein
MPLRLNKTFDTKRKDWYRTQRYLEDSSVAEIEHRLAAIISNMSSLGSDGRVRLEQPKRSKFNFSELMDDIGVELELRGLQNTMQASLTQSHMVQPTYPKIPIGVQLASKYGAPGRFFLVRYTKEKYLGEFLEKGRIRLSPASSFKNDGMLPGIQDNEVEKDRFLPRRFVTVTTLADNKPMKLTSNLKVSSILDTDYYILCTSSQYNPRLFEAFEADCAVFITDLDLFRSRLMSAVKSQVGDWSFACDFVEYYDPLHDNRLDNDLDICFSKTFAYEYQSEFRFAWLPNVPVKALSYRDIELGPLHDVVKVWRL